MKATVTRIQSNSVVMVRINRDYREHELYMHNVPALTIGQRIEVTRKPNNPYLIFVKTKEDAQ